MAEIGQLGESQTSCRTGGNDIIHIWIQQKVPKCEQFHSYCPLSSYNRVW